MMTATLFIVYEKGGKKTLGEVGGGTDVEANPTGMDGNDLTRISIDGTNYNLAGGLEVIGVPMQGQVPKWNATSMQWETGRRPDDWRRDGGWRCRFACRHESNWNIHGYGGTY